MYSARAIAQAKVQAFGAIGHKFTRNGRMGTLIECGSNHNSCCALVLQTALVGSDQGLVPLIRRLAAFSCISSMGRVLAKNLQAMPGYSEEARAFLYERDAPAFVGDFVNESTCCREPGEGFGSIGLSALAEELGSPMHMRLPFLSTTGDEWWTIDPTHVAPEFEGHTTRPFHTGAWHWKLAVYVS